MTKSQMCEAHVTYKKRNTGVLKASLFGAKGARKMLQNKMVHSLRAEVKRDLKRHLIEAKQAKSAIGDNVTFLRLRGCKH